MEFYVIAKFIKDKEITGFRILNKENSSDGFKDIRDMNLSEFKNHFKSTNDKLLNFNIVTMTPLYQSIYSLPIIFENDVSTYLPKVILGYSNGNIGLANLTGQIFQYQETEESFKRICRCKKITGVAIESDGNLYLYDCQMDGRYKKEVIQKPSKCKKEVIFRGYRCINLGDRNYVLTLNTWGSYLGSTKKSLLHFYKRDTNSTFIVSAQCVTPIVKVGMDGVLLASGNYLRLYHRGLEEYYERAMLLCSERVLAMRQYLQVGIFDELVYCRISSVEIPIGVKTITENSLDIIGHPVIELTIPETVTKFHTKAFISIPRCTCLKVFLKNECILVHLLFSLDANIQQLTVVMDCDITEFKPLIKYSREHRLCVEANNFKVIDMQDLTGVVCDNTEVLEKFQGELRSLNIHWEGIIPEKVDI